MYNMAVFMWSAVAVFFAAILWREAGEVAVISFAALAVVVFLIGQSISMRNKAPDDR